MKKAKISYELILAWSTPKRPFVLQKLGFKASPEFHLAYQEAKHIKNLLWKSGGLEKSAVKLVAVSVAGALQKLIDEQAPWLKKTKAAMKKQIAAAKAHGNKTAKTVLQPKTAKVVPIKFTLTPQNKPRKVKVAKTVIAPRPEPMINAIKAKQSNVKSTKQKTSKTR